MTTPPCRGLMGDKPHTPVSPASTLLVLAAGWLLQKQLLIQNLGYETLCLASTPVRGGLGSRPSKAPASLVDCTVTSGVLCWAQMAGLCTCHQVWTSARWLSTDGRVYSHLLLPTLRHADTSRSAWGQLRQDTVGLRSAPNPQAPSASSCPFSHFPRSPHVCNGCWSIFPAYTIPSKTEK